MAARETDGGRQPPRLTIHAAKRFENRAADSPVDPWTAWVDGIPVDLPHKWGLKGDETRYHPDTQVVLCRSDEAIPTVYDLTGDDAHRVIRRAVEQQLDITIEVNR